MTGADTARLQRVHDQLTDAIGQLTESDGWKQLLTVAAKLPTYSPHNVMLIAAQRPDATHVAGYGAWRQLGRQVRKGEHGIQILAPINTRVADADPQQTSSTEAAEREAPTERRTRVLRGFRVAHVFDVAQTDGPPLPEVHARLLDGAAPDGLWQGLAEQVSAAGFSLVRGDCAPANGVTDHGRRTVTVAAALSDAQAVKTLAHELAHVRLHGPSRPAQMDRARAEVEAESVAYLVTTAHGLDPSDYTVPYVAGWSGGDLTVVKATAERVLGTAGDILAVSPPAVIESDPDVGSLTLAPRRQRGLAVQQTAAAQQRRRTLEASR